MRTILLLLSLMLNPTLFLQGVAAQEEKVARAVPTPTNFASMTPEQSRSAVSSLYSALATSAPQQPGTGPAAGDVGLSGSGDSDAGASGNDSGSIKLSQSAMIAIIVVIVVICVFGIASSVLWYLAKKRSWEVRKKLRSSARRVATALTPRRTTFPRDVQNPRKSGRGLTKIEEYPRQEGADIEKGQPRMKKFEMADPPKHAKWGKKVGR